LLVTEQGTSRTATAIKCAFDRSIVVSISGFAPLACFEFRNEVVPSVFVTPTTPRTEGEVARGFIKANILFQVGSRHLTLHADSLLAPRMEMKWTLSIPPQGGAGWGLWRERCDGVVEIAVMTEGVGDGSVRWLLEDMSLAVHGNARWLGVMVDISSYCR
jgi:hypothetical protein